MGHRSLHVAHRPRPKTAEVDVNKRVALDDRVCRQVGRVEQVGKGDIGRQRMKPCVLFYEKRNDVIKRVGNILSAAGDVACGRGNRVHRHVLRRHAVRHQIFVNFICVHRALRVPD